MTVSTLNFKAGYMNVIPNTQREKSILFRVVGTCLCAGFFVAQTPVTTELPAEWDTLVNSLIERIEVHNSDKSDGHSHVKVDIYFTAVGMIDIPTEKEILATMKEIRNNPQDFKFVA